MKIFQKFNNTNSGFTLVITLTMMILLTILAVGLLTLSSVALRSSTQKGAEELARANARLAVMFALGELQQTLGDDRRVTADGSLITGANEEKKNAVGVWKSWSPKLAENPASTSSPAYDAEKSGRFVRWLVSTPTPTEVNSKDWVKSGSFSNPEKLFTLKSDGFNLSGSKVDVLKGNSNAGKLAWAVVQENTRAKINVSGPEKNQIVFKNDVLQAQARPNLSLSTRLKQPSKDWNWRSARVTSFSQAKLDSDLWVDATSGQGRADFTTQSMGLLTDVVNGGLKTDLSLGFEMSDSDFIKPTWGSGVVNPFTSTASPATAGSSKYKSQRPLFKPLGDSATLAVPVSFDPANTQFDFPVEAVPTFHTLRSFYRTPYHLYNSTSGLTVFERGLDHVAVVKNPLPGGYYPSPSKPPPGIKNQTGYRPVVDRVMFLLSVGLSSNNEVRLVCTPLVTLWNPYNMALEIEGVVTYPWIDFPFQTNWTFYKKDGTTENKDMYMSGLLGQQLVSVGHGRSVDPYFYAAVTANGAAIASTGQPISFQPGEVRVFSPSMSTETEFKVNGTVRERTVFLKPVSNVNDLSTKGGLRIPLYNEVRKIGFKRVLATDESVSMKFSPSGGNYHYFMSTEDATLAKGSNPDKSAGGQSIADVLALNFTASGQGETAVFQTPKYSYTELQVAPKPFGVVEFYHRVAKSGSNAEVADLVYTGNPRQSAMTSQVTNSTFPSGPQYKIRMKDPQGSFNGVLETMNGGRNSFYGAGQNGGAGGRTHLSFFEVPRAPMLSLAAFQHTDLSGTPYSTSYQFSNSWASAYVSRDKVATGSSGQLGANSLNYDYSYLTNEALWDGFFFSGASAVYAPGAASGSPSVWDNPIAKVSRPLKSVVDDFIKDPETNPLRNPRIKLRNSQLSTTDLAKEIASPEGCVKFARHIMMDGAFNVNSTSVEAWTALLNGMRGEEFDVIGGKSPGSSATSFPRLRNPIGLPNDNWQGFRALSDKDVRDLATQIVDQVRKRGPFLSLAEFVNRRVESSATYGLKGALQTAIDNAPSLNASALYDNVVTGSFPQAANISPAKTGVGIPGYLTQADVLQSIAPVITPRSDTFTIRGYGEARDPNGLLLATSRCEVVVQRVPDYVDGTNPSDMAPLKLNPVNQRFGRKFAIVSFRYLSPSEILL